MKYRAAYQSTNKMWAVEKKKWWQWNWTFAVGMFKTKELAEAAAKDTVMLKTLEHSVYNEGEKLSKEKIERIHRHY